MRREAAARAGGRLPRIVVAGVVALGAAGRGSPRRRRSLGRRRPRRQQRGGGDGGAILELLFHLIRLCFYFPARGADPHPAIVFFIRAAYVKHKNRDWDSGPPVPLQRNIDLAAIRQVDPDFSQVVFEDFVFRLFAA
ncbi:MAG: hypothetical protein R2939_19625 [Kofleriaceae bacterium]